METANITKARKQAFEWHEGQMYGGNLPYCFHIMDVVRILLEYGYDKENLIIAAYYHDSVEDVKNVTKEVILALTNEKVSRLVDTVSGVGENRKEKKASMIAKLEAYPKAIPLKMADRLANIRSSAMNNRKMLKMYANEMDDYKELFENCDPAMYAEMIELCKGA